MRTFSLSAGADTVVFADTGANNGTDKITGFTAGAGGDKLNFKAFSADLTVGNLNVGASSAQALANNKIYQTTINGDIASNNYGSGTGTKFSELFDASGTPFSNTTTSDSKALIVVKGNDVTQIYYFDNDNNATVANTEVNLVAVIDNNGSGVTLTADNFVF